MHITLNIDLLRWIDANKADKSRAAFIVMKLKELMQDTESNDSFHTKGKTHEVHFTDGAKHAPKQV